MKFIKILLICLLLCACSNNQSFDDIFSNMDASEARLNNYAKYIDYYVPSDLHEVSSDELSFVYELDESKIIMNINIEGIVNNELEEYDGLSDDGFFDDSRIVYSYNNYFLDKENKAVPFFFNLYGYDDYYLMHFVDTYVNIYGYCKANECKLIASKIFDLAKSAEVDTTLILSNYSSKDVIDYTKTTVNLFETVMPVEGRIDDMMIGDDDSVSDE